jgi:hypothetical protein
VKSKYMSSHIHDPRRHATPNHSAPRKHQQRASTNLAAQRLRKQLRNLHRADVGRARRPKRTVDRALRPRVSNAPSMRADGKVADAGQPCTAQRSTAQHQGPDPYLESPLEHLLRRLALGMRDGRCLARLLLPDAENQRDIPHDPRPRRPRLADQKKVGLPRLGVSVSQSTTVGRGGWVCHACGSRRWSAAGARNSLFSSAVR